MPITEGLSCVALNDGVTMKSSQEAYFSERDGGLTLAIGVRNVSIEDPVHPAWRSNNKFPKGSLRRHYRTIRQRKTTVTYAAGIFDALNGEGDFTVLLISIKPFRPCLNVPVKGCYSHGTKTSRPLC